MIALMVALVALLGSMLTVIEVDQRIVFTDLYGNERSTRTAMWCDEETGRSIIWGVRPISYALAVHELAHSADCLDDRLLNGSPGFPKPAVRPRGVPGYCWYDDAEWYACAVVRSASP